MQFRLRTLLIVLAVGPLASAGIVLITLFREPDQSQFDVRFGPWPQTNPQVHSYLNELAGMRKELEDGAAIDEPDIRGWTALHWAVRGNSRQAVQVLLESGASEDVRDKFGFTPIDYARDPALRNMLTTVERGAGSANEDSE